MSDQHPNVSEKESVIVSEDPKPSQNSQLSDPKKRMGKIVNGLKSRIVKKNEEKNIEIDYDEMVGDDDLRYLLVADLTANLIRSHKASQIKPEYEHYLQTEQALEALVPYLLLLMSIFIIFGRPEWCANMETYINYACTKSLDPDYPVEYYTTRTPMLAAATKLFICAVCMTVITLINLFKIKVTVSSEIHRKSLYFCLLLLVTYYFLYAIRTLNIAKPMFMNVFPVLFIIANIPSLQKIVNKTLSILILSKEIIIFYVLILIMVAISARALFYDFPEFYDAEDNNYFEYNYQSLGNSISSTLITFFFADNIYPMIMILLQEYKLYIIYWLVVSLMVKFFLANFVCGVLAYYYNTLFDPEVEFMNEYPDLKLKIKEEIVKETADFSRLKTLVEKYHQSGFYDNEIANIEEFYRVTTVDRINTWNADNPHNITNLYNQIIMSNKFIIGIGLFEFLGILLIIFSLGEENSQIFYIYIGLFIINLLLFCERVVFLIHKRIDSKDNFIFFDMLLTLIIGALIIFHMLSSNENYTQQLIEDNRGYKKMIGFLFTLKATRFLSLFLYQKEIKIVVTVAFKSFGFIADIILIVIMLFFIFATIGISLFGGNMHTGSHELFEERYGDELAEELTPLNFNDYYHAFYSLFIVMIGGWALIVQLNTIPIKPSVLFDFFFITFHFLTNLCFLNIIFGFVVGSVDSYVAAAAQAEQDAKDREAEANLDVDDNNDDGNDDNDYKGGDDEENDLNKKKGKANVLSGVNNDIKDSSDNKDVFIDDLDAYIDFKKKPRPELIEQEDEQKIDPDDSNAKPSNPKKLTLRTKKQPSGDYDPLEEIVKSIKIKREDE